MNNTREIKGILPEISRELSDFSCQDDYGLLSGACGGALFHAYHYKLTGKKKSLACMNRVLEKTITALAQNHLLVSHCSGVSGIVWCIQHLIKNGFIEQYIAEDIFEEVDQLLSLSMKHQLGRYRYDFLHEGLGIMLYFIEKLPDEKGQLYLEEAVTLLEKTVERNIAGFTWRDYSSLKNKNSYRSVSYNAGLSHGVPAILSILSILYEKGVATDKSLPLIESGVQWLLGIKNDHAAGCVSLYPSTFEGDATHRSESSRLGWCYGDLSIAVALMNIAKRLQSRYIMNEACRIFDYTLTSRNLKNGGVVDASLCHGSMGVSHIYRRAYRLTHNETFLDGARLWLQHTIQMATWKNGLAGFKYQTPEGYQNSYNLLEGIAGIGLGLIAALDNDISSEWDRCLLIS